MWVGRGGVRVGAGGGVVAGGRIMVGGYRGGPTKTTLSGHHLVLSIRHVQPAYQHYPISPR